MFWRIFILLKMCIRDSSMEESATPVSIQEEPAAPSRTVQVDACGMQCPGPILKMKKTMDTLVPVSYTHLLPSGVSSDREASRQASTNACSSTPGAVWNLVALRLDVYKRQAVG